MLDLCLGSFQEERKGQGGRGLLSKAGFSSGRLTAAAAKSLQSCPTLCDPRDGSPPGSPVPGILQARTLKYTQVLKNLPANTGDIRDVGSIPGSGRSPGGVHGN